MKQQRIPVLDDNYAWLLVSDQSPVCGVVDPSDADPIIAANPENFFLQRIGDTTVFFKILHQFPGFIDKKVKFFLTFIAAHI